ncbi:MAG: polyprenyl diphosphate synthase [Clostridiaceae bacterium]|nr:polyprenyl diphosphate synthase [Clostridiaceae bacterium]
MIPEGTKLPTHIAMVMDGNGRWAQTRGLPRTAGHKAGAETFRRIATHCSRIGLPYLTVYAFSTENWKRPENEVRTIMELLRKYLLEAREKMVRENIALRIIGDQSRLPEPLRELIRETDELSQRTNGLRVNVCLNYGARDELTRAVRSIACDAAAGRLDSNDVTPELLSSRLDTAGIPDPDLIIRPGAEHRLSNYLLWQAAYAELLFSDTLWPDFDEEELDRAIVWFSTRIRRFGGV